MPEWLVALSTISLIVAALCTLFIGWDIVTGHSQKMRIMNLVWPITALYSGPLGVAAYYRFGRTPHEKPFWQSVAVGATHCGSGCTLGDLAAEWLIFFAPFTLVGDKMFDGWILDYVFAYLFGIAFQYFTIKPMKQLTVSQGLWAAIKADTLSLTAWQVGMYGWMAVARFLVFGHEIPKTSPVFWFVMQLAMLAGFVTSYPVNWFLLRKGVKEVM